MTAVYIILGILLFFFLLSLLRIGVRADFAGDIADTSVTVIAGPARIQMLPKPDKPEKPKKPKKEKKKKTPQEESAKGKEKKKLSLSAQDIKTLLPAVWASLKGGLRKTRQRLLIDPLELSAVLPGAMDPAGAAELYGYINAGMWTVMPQLEQLTRIPDPGLHVEVDFDSEQLRLTGRLGVSLQIRDLFAIGWAFAKPVIRWLLAMRKRQSAAEKAKAAAQSAAKQRETVHTAPDGAGHTTTSTSTKES